MKRNRYIHEKFSLFAAALAVCAAPTLAHAENYGYGGFGGFGQNSIELTPLGTLATGIFDDGAAEIVAYDPGTKRLFVVNGANATIDVLDISDPSNPTALTPIDVTIWDGMGVNEDAKANSVAVHDGLVAAAIENVNTQAPGAVLFFDADGTFLNRVVVGDLADGTDSALPDMVTFSPNGDWVLVANEGEPDDNYLVDPEGSVSIIDLRFGVENASVTNIDFRAFNGATLDPSIRIFGPGATVAQDLEPEFIAVSADSSTAWVAIQENNAVATIDIASASVTSLSGLGFKDHSDHRNTLDASNADDIINPTPWPVNGMYQPDSAVTFEVYGETYLITANEGDAREYLGTPGFVEETTVADVTLDPTAFPNAAMLQDPANLGALTITNTLGNADGDEDFDALFAFGARSFSIWKTNGTGPVDLIFDSGDALEQITAAYLPGEFNSTNDENMSFDDRSDSKGPEPEGLAVGVVDGRTYAFIGLERIGGIVVYDVSNPYRPSFVQYINTRDFSGNAMAGTAGDLAPEGLAFISAADSPTGQPLLAVAFEVSGSTTIFGVDEVVAQVDFRHRVCDGTLTGVFNTIVAASGETCILSDALVFGSVRAEYGSTLFVHGGGIFGNVAGDPGSSVAVLSSFVGGSIRCEDAVAPSGCQVSRAIVGGNVRSRWAEGGFVNVFSNYVDGNVRLTGNTVKSLVSLNTIGRDLTCRGNNPAPKPGGLPPTNTVFGDKEDQCDANFGF